MTPLIITAALGLLALDSAPATTPTAPPPGPAAAASHAKPSEIADLDKVICKSQPITGSRFVKRVCMTRAEWNEQQRHTEEFERHINQTPNGAASGGLGGG